MNLKLGIVSLVLIGMCGGLAAATISISGYVSNGGKPFPNKIIHVHVAGYDTLATTNGLGYYTTQVQTIRTQGIVQVQMVDTCGDTIRNTGNLSPRNTVFRLDLQGCVNSTFHLSGRLINFQQSGSSTPVLLSFNSFRSISDTLFADSLGYYSKTISSNQSIGFVQLGVWDCKNQFVSDSTLYRVGDTVKLNLDFCSSAANMHRGKVLLGSVPIQSNMINLLRYRFNPVQGEFHFIDTLVINGQGEFQFIKDQYDYLIKAIPTNVRSGIVPTYYPSGQKWTDRNTLAIGPHSTGNLNLFLQQIRPAAGMGGISGEVLLDSSLNTNGFGARELVVYDEFGTALAFETVMPNQKFVISNLAYGKYQVWIDQCGIPTEAKWINLSSAQPNFTGLIISASYQGIGNDNFVSTQELPFRESDAKVYPNPFFNHLNVETSLEVNIQVLDYLGREILSLVKSSGVERIETSTWKKGVYLLKITEGDKIYTRQIVK